MTPSKQKNETKNRQTNKTTVNKPYVPNKFLLVSYVQLVAQWLKRPPPRPFLHTHLDLYNHRSLLRLIRSTLIAARSCCLGPFRQIFTIILLLFLWSWKTKGKKTWRNQYQLLSSWESSKWLKGTKTKSKIGMRLIINN